MCNAVAHPARVAMMRRVNVPEPTNDPTPPRRRLSRRKLLKYGALGTVVAGLGVGGWTWQIEPFWCELVERPLRLEQLPPRWVGRTIVQISDIHTLQVRQRYLLKQFARVNALRPDLIVITGDFAGVRRPDGLAPLRELLRTLAIPPLGAFACLGNHDYGPGWADLACADAVTAVAGECGIRVLRNERVVVDGLELLGTDDLWSPAFDGVRTLARAAGDGPSITLCHNPDAQDLSFWGDYRGVVLAGHTHGGQCKPPFLPPPILPVKNERYVAGEYAIVPGRSLYVSRGVGHTLQARFNCRPELTRFTLARA
jgi:uncharacterized protein